MVAGEVQSTFAFGLFLFPAPSAEVERQTQTELGPDAARTGAAVPACWALCTAAGQRSSMSQVLFQQLVPLQVKCRDCEER